MRQPYSIEHLRRLAKRRMPAVIFDFLDGGVLDELALSRNQRYLRAILMEERVLFDASKPQLGTRVLDTDFAIPLLVSPMGMLAGFHPRADLAVAQAAHEAGSIFVHSAWSSCSMEVVAAVAPANTWVQVAFWNDEHEYLGLLDRAKALGVETLAVAGDVAVSQRRERDIRHGAESMPPKLPLKDVVDSAFHPAWVLRWLTGRRITYGNYTKDGRPLRMREMMPWMERNTNASASWENFKELRHRWDGKLIVKGIMSEKDAKIAVKLGADGVLISNHGGRQFDVVPATAEVVPRIADAVGGKAAIIVDGGVRRGSDVAKLLALGADLVGAGRPFAFGLGAMGPGGPARVFDIFREELETTLGFIGVRDIRELSREVLAYVPEFGTLPQ